MATREGRLLALLAGLLAGLLLVGATASRPSPRAWDVAAPSPEVRAYSADGSGR